MKDKERLLYGSFFLVFVLAMAAGVSLPHVLGRPHAEMQTRILLPLLAFLLFFIWKTWGDGDGRA